jgi:hypothetical protein
MRAIDDEIGRLEAARSALLHEAMELNEPQSGRRVDRERSGPDRSDEQFQER